MKKQLLICGAIVIALVSAMILAPPPADGWVAGCRSYGSCYQPTYYYSQPEYIYVDRIIPVAYPVPFTVAVPVVSYLWNGGYGVPGYSPVYGAQPANGAPTVQVPQQQPAPMPQNGTNGNGAPRTPALLQLTDAELDYLIGRIEERLTARAKNGNGQQQPTTPPPPVPQEKGSRPIIYSDNDVVRVLSTKVGKDSKSCMDCHAGTSHKGGMKIFNSPGVLNQGVNWSKIWDAADSGRMPKEAQTNKAAVLSDADCEVLRWKMMQGH